MRETDHALEVAWPRGSRDSPFVYRKGTIYHDRDADGSRRDQILDYIRRRSRIC